MTHSMPRSSRLPQKYHKAAFVQFHLLVDDIAHLGKIDDGKTVIDFNPNSNGYAYVKGRPLVQPIMDFCRGIGHETSLSEAAYRSHLIIEMSFDLALCGKDRDLMILLYEALNYTAENKLSEFSETLGWILSVSQEIIMEAIQEGITLCTQDRINNLMSIEGQIGLFANKFSYDSDDDRIWNGIWDLFNQGRDLVTDYEEFSHTVLATIKESGFKAPL